MEADKGKLLVVGALGLILGYFVGREHMKYEIRSAMSNALSTAFSGFGTQANPAPSAQSLASDVRKTEAAEYAKNIEVYDFEASMKDSLTNGRVPGLNFKLKNNGDKTVSQVKVTVYFQDGDGKNIAEEDFYPINTSSIMGGGPLKPGYVWQQEKGKFYMAKSVPSEWKPGAASIAVTGVELAD